MEEDDESSRHDGMSSQHEKLEAYLDDFEHTLERLNESAREAVITSLSEDEGMKEQVRSVLLQIARERKCAHEAAAVFLSENHFDDENQFREIMIMAVAAVKGAMDEEENPRGARGEKKEKGSSRGEKFELGLRRVQRAELAVAKRIAGARTSMGESCRREFRECAKDVHGALFERELRGDHEELVSSRPHIVEAFASFDKVEIESALQILAAPVALYFRYYSNLFEIVPRMLLVLVGCAVLIPQQLAPGGNQCKDVLEIGGISFLPLSGWLAAQIVCDVCIIVVRIRIFALMRPLMNHFALGGKGASERFEESERTRVFSKYLRSDEEQHPLEALIPLEAATERGERAMIILGRLNHDWTLRIPLAFLTLLSFTLGLAGGIYLLLPFARSDCNRSILLIANSYIAFFYIFFILSLIKVAVAVADLTESCTPMHSRLESRFVDLDKALFLDQIPFFTFVARMFLLGHHDSFPHHLTGTNQLKKQLKKDADLLDSRRAQLKEHIEDLDAQIDTTNRLLDTMEFGDHRNSTSIPEQMKIKRYTQKCPEITWRTSFVPVYVDDYENDKLAHLTPTRRSSSLARENERPTRGSDIFLRGPTLTQLDV